MDDEKKKILLKNRIITREQKNRIQMNEFKLSENVERKFKYLGELQLVFGKRKSCRKLKYSVKIDKIMAIVNEIRADKRYRPTPVAGNVDCLTLCIYNYPEKEIFFVPINYHEDVFLSYETSMSSLLEENINRIEYNEKNGVYIFFLISIDKIRYKYLDMAEPLLYTTLGCLIQNITLALSYNDIQSCIHFGMNKQIEMEISGWNYFCPCFLKVGKESV